MTLLIFIAVLFVTVMVHEWGHFITAKRSGMLVEEFGFGIPPRIYAWKKGETTYSINALPFGGFVKIAGENGTDSSKDPSRQFDSKPWHLRALVLVAGVVCNTILAIVLFSASFMLGTPAVDEVHGTPTVLSVTPNMPIAEAGLAVGDTIVSITQKNKILSPLTTEHLKEALRESKEPLSVTYKNKTEEKTVVITPIKTDQGITAIGIAVEPVVTKRLSLFEAVPQAVLQTVALAKGIFHTVGALVESLFTREGSLGELVGPVGLAKEVRQASAIGFSYLLAFTALISVNLAVLNILPFPALDGGRLVIIIVEKIVRKNFSKKTIGIIHSAGFLLLITLMIVLSVKDVKALF